MKRYFLLLAMLIVSGILFTGAASAAAPDSFDIMNAANVIQTSPNTFEAVPMTGKVSLAAAPGSYFYEQNGQVYYQTPNGTYNLGISGAQACSVKSVQVDIYASGTIKITITSNRPFIAKIEKIPGGVRVTIYPQ